MASSRDVNGIAALSICESLLLCLVDLKVLDREDMCGILSDAAAAHRHAASEGVDADSNLAAEEMILALKKGIP